MMARAAKLQRSHPEHTTASTKHTVRMDIEIR